MPEESYLEDDFILTPSNNAAWQVVQNWPDCIAASPVPVAGICGDCGSGKSHLANIWARRNNGFVMRYEDLSLSNPYDICSVTHNIACEIDDYYFRKSLHDPDHTMLTQELERNLFHLINLVRQQGGHQDGVYQQGGGILITSVVPISKLPVTLPDLASRLRGAFSANLNPPDDELMFGATLKRLNDFGYPMRDDIANYIVKHCSRSLAEVNDVVKLLANRAQQLKKPLSINLLRQVIEG
jgi:chromosomal replication initiation ATPase DnaA